MPIPVSRLLPATVVVAAMVLGFKVVALATPSSEAVLHRDLTSPGQPQALRRGVAMAASEPAEASSHAAAPQRPAPHAAPASPAVLPTPLRALSAAPATEPAVSVQGVALQGAAAPAGQGPLPGTVPPPPPKPALPAVPAPIPSVRPEPVPASVAAPAAAATGGGGDDLVAGPDVLKARRSQAEDRERALVQREAVAAAAEKQLGGRVAELTALQDRLQALESGLKDRDEANWAGMVKTYEGMRPRDAAAIFNDLDKPVLIEIVDRMKPSKATLVIAAMNPEKARQVTVDLATRRTRSTTVPN